MVRVDLGLSNTLAVEAAPSTPPRQPGLAAAVGASPPPGDGSGSVPPAAPPPPSLQLGVLEGRQCSLLQLKRAVAPSSRRVLNGPRLSAPPTGIPGVAGVTKDRLLRLLATSSASPVCPVGYDPNTVIAYGNASETTPYGIIKSQVNACASWRHMAHITSALDPERSHHLVA